MNRFSGIPHELLMPLSGDPVTFTDANPALESCQMNTDASSTRPSFLNGWRIAGWGSLLAILLLPAFAMKFTAEVNWTASDFVFAAMLLGFLGTVVELAVRLARPGGQRIGYVVADMTTFLTLWSNAAVGIIGDDERDDGQHNHDFEQREAGSKLQPSRHDC